jgi:hypothetical protein
MTIRISSTYSSGYGGAYYGYGNTQRQLSTDSVSIWGESPSFGSDDFIGANNGVEGVNYAQPGASFVPMDQVMTAPFGANEDMLGNSGYGQNPFASFMQNSTSIFSSFMGGQGFNSNFLSLTGNHSNHHSAHHSGHHSGHHSDNVFRNSHVNSHDLHLRSTNERTGNFGRQTTSIHTPSVDFNTREINDGNRSISKTNISGNINSFKQTNQHINTPTANLNRTRQVVDTPTERITRTRTKGTIWV